MAKYDVVVVGAGNAAFCAAQAAAEKGAKVLMTGAMRPAFALVSASAGTVEYGPAKAVERALDRSAASSCSRRQRTWIRRSKHRSCRPTGCRSTATSVRRRGGRRRPVMRRDLSTKIARTFDAQGIASVVGPLAGQSQPRRGRPCSGPAAPNRTSSSSRSTARKQSPTPSPSSIAQSPSCVRPSASRPSTWRISPAPSSSASPAAPAPPANVQPGDIIVKANDQAVNNSSALATVLATCAGRRTRHAGARVKDKAGAAKKADGKVEDDAPPDRHERSTFSPIVWP